MKWITANPHSNKESFEFWDDEKKIASISFSKQTRFVRMVSNLGKRMFSFETKGLLHPKKVIRNEYGIKLGKVELVNPEAGKGIVVFEGKKYTFEFDGNNTGELVLFDETRSKNLLTCSFKMINSGIYKTKSLIDGKFTSLLLILCWYTFQPHNNPLPENNLVQL